MMRLILAPKSMEGIEEKLLKSWDRKIGPKISKNCKNEKRCSSLGDMIQSKSMPILKQIKCLQGVETTQTFSHSLEDCGDLSLL
jgi:hypothetical protein